MAQPKINEKISRSRSGSPESGLHESGLHESGLPTIHIKSTIEQRRQRDAEMVKGRFTFTEVQGGTLSFSFRKYKDDPIKSYSLKDGEIVTIPRGVAKHLASNGSYPIHEYATDENGRPLMRIKSYKKRYNFESLEFFDEEDLSSSKLYTVERV